MQIPISTLGPVLIALLSAPAAHAVHLLEGRDLAQGETLYLEQCAACHGASLEGQANWQTQQADGTMPAPPHDATGHTWHHSDAFLFAYTKDGGARTLSRLGVEGVKSAMPAFGGILSDEDIADVLGYMRSTWPRQVQDIQADRSTH